MKARRSRGHPKHTRVSRARSATDTRRFPDERFTVCVGRWADDLWVEVRRRRIAPEDVIPTDLQSPGWDVVRDALAVRSAEELLPS